MLLRFVEGVRDGGGATLRLPLLGAGRALGQLPFVVEQVVEEVVAPLRGRLRPGDFRAARDGVGPDAGSVAALPAEALILDEGAFRLRADQRRITGAVGLAEGVAAGNQRDGLLVVHRHAEESFADVLGGRDRIRIAVRPLRIDVDQAHLHRTERILQLAFAAVAFVPQPRPLGTPVELLGLPHVGTPAGETERLEAHRLEGDVAGEDHQVGPGDFPAVLLLDRPQEPARLVEVGVVRPAVEGREALLAGAGAAAAIGDAVGAGAVPGHADEQPPVVAEVGRPPRLRVRHQGLQVLDHRVQVEGLEFLGVVERLAHRIGPGGALVENLNVQLVRPPVAVRVGAGPAGERALAIVHIVSSSGMQVSRRFCARISRPAHLNSLKPARRNP